MSPGDIDRFLGGDDDQWPEDEGKAQWPKEKMSAGDVDAFLGPDSPGNDSDSSDGAEAPPPPSSSASSVAPPLDADDAAEIAAMASSSDPFGAPANPFAAPAAPAVADDGATSPAADFAADAFGADPFGAPPEPTATAGAADAPAAPGRRRPVRRASAGPGGVLGCVSPPHPAVPPARAPTHDHVPAASLVGRQSYSSRPGWLLVVHDRLIWRFSIIARHVARAGGKGQGA